MRRPAIALACLALSAASVQAGPPFSVTVEREPIHPAEPVFCVSVKAGGEIFTFMIPENYHLGGDSAHGRLTLENVETGSLMTFSFLDSASGEAPTLNPDAYREMLATRYPHGKFGGESRRPALGRAAHVFEIEWQGRGGLAQKTRALYVATNAGILELTVTSGVKNFRQAQAAFDISLGSIAVRAAGQPKVIYRGGPS